jgi:hypothetical protein
MKRLAIICGFALGSAVVHGQIQYPYLQTNSTDPTGNACSGGPQLQLYQAGNKVDMCGSGNTYIAIGGGTGTVTSVTGTANQIDVATGTTTPVISLDPSLILPSGTTLVAPVLGTPASGVITNLTGTCASCVANSATLSAPIASPTFTGTVTAPLEVISGNGAASVAPLIMTGTTLTGGSGTTNFPAFFIQPTAATGATTWSTSGTLIGLNPANGFSGNIIDYHKNGGPSNFKIDQFGDVTASSGNFIGAGFGISTTAALQGGTGALQMGSAELVIWSSTAAYTGGKDTGLDRNAAGVVEVNTGSAGSGGSLKATGIIAGSYQQTAASSTGGTCAMSTSTSCTITLGHTYTTPVCIVTQQSATLTGGAAGCTISGTTVTITAAVANSETWGAFVFGNPN